MLDASREGHGVDVPLSPPLHLLLLFLGLSAAFRDLVLPGIPPLLLWAILKVHPETKPLKYLGEVPGSWLCVRIPSSTYSASIIPKPRKGQPLADSHTAEEQRDPPLLSQGLM